jgi:murein DD-endopeptidase MepM/ murein hydrolase activator NlpD
MRGIMSRQPGRGVAGAPSTRRGRLRVLAGALALALALLPALGLVGSAPPPAFAFPVDYPTWDEVKQAQRSETAAKQLKSQLEASLAGLQAEVTRTQAEAEAKGQVFFEAQLAYDEQALITEQYETQAAEAEEKAAAALRIAGQLIAELSRSGSADVSTRLFTSSSASADGMLYRLGAADKLGDRYAAVYARALTLQNSATALAEQAETARQERDRLKGIAEAAFAEAQAAAEAAAAVLAKTEQDIGQLRAKIAVLTEQRQATEADYLAGVRERWGSGAGGEISASGWARPSGGYISSAFGMRYHPIYRIWKLHSGVDLAGVGCGAPIYAARAGTVTYAGPNGDLGNYIQINHGDGTTSGYGHIQAGGIGVSFGQTVDPGQLIARVGSTGGSTGCHLHFMIRVNGALTDPVPFMRNQGITLG